MIDVTKIVELRLAFKVRITEVDPPEYSEYSYQIELLNQDGTVFVTFRQNLAPGVVEHLSPDDQISLIESGLRMQLLSSSFYDKLI